MAGRETVTITEFSNGNGSADGQACSEEWVGVGWWCGFNKVRDGTETAAPSLVCVWGGSMLGWEGAWSGTVSDAVRGVGH